MTLQTVTLTWDLTDLIQAGAAATLTIWPTSPLTAAADSIIITQLPRSVSFTNGTGELAGIVANDNAGLEPAGQGYQIVVTTPATVLAPAVVLLQQTVAINHANGATQDLSGLTEIEPSGTFSAYLPLTYPDGASDSFVWTTDADGNGSWQPAPGGTGSAPLASPAFTGDPTAPTQAAGDASTKLATDAFVAGAVAAGSAGWINAAGPEYGADPTGASDSAAAINAALAAAPLGGVVVLPPGTYETTEPIIIPPQVTLLGSHSSHIDSTVCAIKPASSFTGAAAILLVDEATGGYPVPSGQQGIFFLTLEGSSLTGTTIDGIQAQGYVHGVVIQDVQIRDMPDHGIATVDNGSGVAYSWRLTRVAVYTCTGFGFSPASLTDTTFIDCEAIGNLKAGFNIAGSPSNSHFISCRAEYNGYDGFALSGAWSTATGAGGCTFTSCSTDGNNQNGFHVTATGSAPVTLTGCMFRRDGANGILGGAGYAGLKADGCTIPLIVDGLTVYPGIALSGGVNSPEYGFAAVNSAAGVVIQSASLHAATTAWYDDGSNSNIQRGPNIIERTGTTASWSTAYNGLQATDTGLTFVNGSAGSSVNLLAGTPVASALPAGALAETIPRWFAQTSSFALSSGILYIHEITLQGGVPTTHGHWLPGSTGCASPNHWWYVLLSSSRQVVAVTADQTSTAITASQDTPLAWAASYTPAATGIFYLGVMVAAGSMPTSAASSAAPAGSVFTGLPLGGESNTGETTAPALGTTMTAPTVATQIPYMYAA